MTPRPAGSLLNYLEQVPDPRGRQGLRHSLAAMLAASVCAILSGFRGYGAIAQWIRAQDVSLWHRLGFTRQPPTESCFRDLFLVLSPQALEEALLRWITEGLGLTITDEPLQTIIIDGKTLRGTHKKHERTYQALTLLDQKTGFVLSERAIDPVTNEAKTALALLTKMVLDGKLVVGDAAYCDREICQEIVDSGGEYLVVIKDNQPTLHHDARQAFVIPRSFSPLRSAQSP